MAITAPTKTSDFAGFIQPDIAEAIFEEAAKQSLVQQLVPRIELGAKGVAVPVVTGKPKVGWVDEGSKKPTDKGSQALRTITPKKAAAIVVVSAEVVRANPGKYVDNLRPQLAGAFANAFDLAALHGKASDGAAAGPFADYVAKATKSVELGTATAANGGIHADLVAALKLLVADKRRLTGWAVDEVVEPLILGATDTTGKPVFSDTPTGVNDSLTAGRLLRRPALLAEGLALPGDADKIVGFAGDFSKARWGVVGGISYDVSTQATVTINGQLVSLWEENLVAIRAEAEYGFMLADPTGGDFVKLADKVE